jgi:hypothetical protein
VHREGVPQVVEPRLEKGAILAMYARRAADDPEVAVSDLWIEGQTVYGHKELTRQKTSRLPWSLLNVVPQRSNQLGADRNETTLVELGFVYYEQTLSEIHVIDIESQRFIYTQSRTIEEQDERTEGGPPEATVASAQNRGCR